MTGLSAVAQNTALLDLLREQGVPQAGGSSCYDGWVLHTHPDLIDRLEGLAPDWRGRLEHEHLAAAPTGSAPGGP